MTPQKPIVVNNNRRPWWEWLILGLLLVGLIALAIYALRGCANTNSIATPPPTPPVVVNAPADLKGWDKCETADLLPGQACLGDVVVSWPGWKEAMAAYDRGGNGEGTIVLNKSSKAASIFAEWGAGRVGTTDTKELVNGELAHGCGSLTGCKTVRVVVLTDSGTSVEFFNTPVK